jgi:hypothetical protein
VERLPGVVGAPSPRSGGIQRRSVHGFRATAACQFVDLKRALGDTEAKARWGLATHAPHVIACDARVGLGQNLHRTEVTSAYVPEIRSA